MAKDGFLQLKRLEISSCEMMEEVFSNDGEEGHITFPKLENLSLVDLPSLTTFCKGIEGIEYPVLWEMEIDRCSKLTSFVSSTGNSSSLAGHSDDCLHFFCNQKVAFGSLRKLCMGGYKNISNLWCHKIPSAGFFLEELDIRHCGSIRSLFTSSIDVHLVNLKRLNISSCNEMVKLIGDDEENVCKNSQLIFPNLECLSLYSLPNLVIFCGWRCDLQLPSLLHLKIEDCPRIESFTMGPLCTPKLESIIVQDCDKLHNLFPLTMAKNGLLQLKDLHVMYCKSIEEVFFNVNENDGKCHITFPELEYLSLDHLPSLATFYKGIESIEFPRLKVMNIKDCPKLTGFATCSENNPSVAGHSDDSFHLFCNQKVTFGSLKKLTISGYKNISNLWCHQISPAGFFNKLEELDIYYCGSIRSLFSSSVARNLVNLKKLSVWNCNEMVKVIGDHEENVCKNSQLIFPSLDYLSLISLPNLVNFCGWRCALQLSSLTNLYIYGCPRRESFTMGSLTTPKLGCIKIDHERKEVEDLNGAVQRYFVSEKHEEKESDEEENESDEHVQEVWDEEKHDQESAQTEKQQEESNKEDQEDGEREKVETEEEEIKQIAEENCSSN